MHNHGISLPLVDAALAYRAAGLSVIATKGDKAPAVMTWTQYQKGIADEGEMAAMFMNTALAKSLGIICGDVSGNLECIDFDNGGSAWEEWRALVEAELPGALDGMVIETSPSGGRHLVYRCPMTAIPGPQKLASRPSPTTGNRNARTVLIETRGEGAYFCAAPSPGYELVQGDFLPIPSITQKHREVFLRAARFLDECPLPEERPQTVRTVMPSSANHYRPGDDFNAKCGSETLFALLERHGWTFWKTRGENAAWTRPGKNKGISATVRNIDGMEVFYPFTTSTGFEANRGYSPFQVFAVLEYGGDYVAAAAALGSQGYGKTDTFDHSAFAGGRPPDPPPDRPQDPGPVKADMLNVPGFINLFCEHTNRRSVKRQPVLALGAGLVGLGALTARKVEGITGLRTNLYALGVAETGTGKNTPREMLRQLLSLADNEVNLVDRLRSDAGIRAALEVNPCVAFVLDEIGEFLETIKQSRHSTWVRNIIPELMMLYSQAASPNVKLGGLGDASKNITVDCPHICLYGTSVPTSVFQSMTMHSVTNGFIGRLMLFESSHGNPERQRPWNEPFPEKIVQAVEFWKNFRPGGGLTGNHAGAVAAPMVVQESAEATAVFDSYEAIARQEIEQYGIEWSGPYNRVEENARKLAILYACSECMESPFIGKKAAEWSCKWSLYSTRRLVYLGSMNIADNETHD